MKFSKLAIALYMGLIFLCGAVLGVFGQRLYDASVVIATKGRNPEEHRKRALAEYQSRLKLTDEQVAQVNSLMDETRARVSEVRKQMHPAFEKISDEQNRKFRDLLKPEQQSEFDKMLKEREERQKQSGGRGPGPGI